MAPNSKRFISSKPIPLNEQGKAHISESFACIYTYFTVNDNDVELIIELKHAFDKPIAKVSKELKNIDSDCPHIHHIKPRRMDESLAYTEVTKASYPLPCTSGICSSKLRILCAASIPYLTLSKLLHAVHKARIRHGTVDIALCSYDHKILCKLVCVKECEDLTQVKRG